MTRAEFLRRSGGRRLCADALEAIGGHDIVRINPWSLTHMECPVCDCWYYTVHSDGEGHTMLLECVRCAACWTSADKYGAWS